jgi:hypothetical protein
MYAVRELLNLKQESEMTQLTSSGMTNGPAALAARIEKTLDSGGIVKAYVDQGQVLGLCLVRNDGWNHEGTHLMITELLAAGLPADQTLIRARMLGELLLDLQGHASVLTARIPIEDRSSATALVAMGFRPTGHSTRPGDAATQWEDLLKPLGCTLGPRAGGVHDYQYKGARAA